MLQISETYPKDRQMQTTCRTLMESENGFVQKYMKALYPDRQGKALAKSVGLDYADLLRRDNLLRRQEQLGAPHAAKQALELMFVFALQVKQ